MMRNLQPQPQPQATCKFDLCSIAKLPGVDRVAKKVGERVWADNKNPKQTAG